MDLLWLTSSRRDTSDLPAFLSQARILELTDVFDPFACKDADVIAIEVTCLVDAERAFDVLSAVANETPGPSRIWIYYPDATVASTVSFLKAGATHVMERLDQIEAQIEAEPDKCIAFSSSAGKPLIGSSRATQAVAASIELVANRRCNVLIEGETGTGKEVVARAIHARGDRSRGPWIAVNCGAIPETLLEAELFGHVRGAFTGAVQPRAGKFEAANRGTIFLDEIGELPLPVQAKLLRVLQEREVERLGGNERIPLDVRVIAASNSNLGGRVADGSFRQDLFFRLNVFRIALAPLRDRVVDIAPLAQHFAARICASENIPQKTVDASALRLLLGHDWPGNARELENVMETAVILSGTRASIYASDIRFGRTSVPGNLTVHTLSVPIPPEGLDYQQALHSFERDLLAQAISRTRGNKSAAADLLRLKRTTLSARMRVLESRLPRLVA